MPVRKALAVALAIVLMLAAVGCSSDGNGASSGAAGSDNTESGSSASAGIDDLDALKAHLAEKYADTEWYPHLKDLKVEKQLGANVIVGAMDLTLEDKERMDLAGEANSAIANAQPSFATNSSIRGSGAGFIGQGWGQKTAAEALGLPAAPTDAAGMKTWIDAAFGDSGEPWVDAITSVSGSGSTLLIKTNLPYNQETTLIGQRISSAVALSGQTFATEIDVLSSDGNNYLIMGQPWPSNLTY